VHLPGGTATAPTLRLQPPRLFSRHRRHLPLPLLALLVLLRVQRHDLLHSNSRLFVQRQQPLVHGAARATALAAARVGRRGLGGGPKGQLLVVERQQALSHVGTLAGRLPEGGQLALVQRQQPLVHLPGGTATAPTLRLQPPRLFSRHRRHLPLPLLALLVLLRVQLHDLLHSGSRLLVQGQQPLVHLLLGRGGAA